tara:strand:- start:22 stop:162 length:141 start_codon:yes stop_codon:yes gene_type:complete
MKDLIKKALDEFAETNTQTNLASEASRELLADFILNYCKEKIGYSE